MPHYHAVAFSDSTLLAAVSEVESTSDKGGLPTGKFLSFREKVPAETTFYADSAVRKTVIEMHQVFDECRQLALTKRNLSQDEVLSFSLRYRSVLQGAAMTRRTEEAVTDFVAWSLFEALFFSRADSAVSMDLVKWALTSFLHGQSILSDVVAEAESDGRSVDQASPDLFWKATVLQLISFRFDLCARLLADNSRQDTATETLEAQLRRMDAQWMIENNETDYYTKWQEGVREQYEAGVFDENMNIKFLAGVIVGDDVVYRRLAEVIVDQWWQLVPFYMITFFPGADMQQLAQVAERCRSLFGDRVPEQDVFVPLFHFDALTVLQELCEPAYMAVHLIDLLHKSGSQAIERTVDMRYFVFTEYATTLVANSQLWEIGSDYLCETGTDGRAAVERHLSAMHVDGERTANKIWRLVKKESLDDAARMLVNTMTNRYIRVGGWSAALGWALRGDSKCRAVDTLCGAILQRASCEQVTQLNILEQVGTRVLQSTALTFLYNYFTFNKLLAQGAFVDAVRKLVAMLQTSSVPPRFHDRLFEHLQEILGTREQVVVEKSMVIDLLVFIKQYTIQHSKSDKDPQLLTLKNYLAKSLARSVVTFA